MLKKILIDKTERHFDVELEDLKDNDENKSKRQRKKPRRDDE